MPGAPLELHEREEIFRALVEDPQAGWAAIAVGWVDIHDGGPGDQRRGRP